MHPTIDARTLKGWLSDGGEIALLDVRESGQFGEGHLFFAVPLPYSRLEIELQRLVPNPRTRIVVHDGGDANERTAEQAALRARATGYTSVTILAGGVAAWAAAGYTLYKGVNVPSKTFGELVEMQRHTPRIAAVDLAERQARGDDIVVLDGRPLGEYRKMTIPQSVCCPNGELALRAKALVPRPETTIIVNCAGRTRSIIGAQTLIDVGVPNKVLALENGTQGWFLAGLPLDHDATRTYPKSVTTSTWEVDAVHAFARRAGVATIKPVELTRWLADPARTTYLFDVRTPEEFAAATLAGAEHAPGGQLIQATDQWVGVRGARIVLADDDGIRAPVIAAWLRQLGHEACVLEGGIHADVAVSRRDAPHMQLPTLRPMSAQDLSALLWAGGAAAIDLRPSMTYRKAHVPGSRWSIRPQLADLDLPAHLPIVLIADDERVAAAARLDLPAGRDVRWLDGGIDGWLAEGLTLNAASDVPPDADCIDYLFFTHDRHDGNEAASRQYLAWETGLLAQLDAQERGTFRVLADRH